MRFTVEWVDHIRILGLTIRPEVLPYQKCEDERIVGTAVCVYQSMWTLDHFTYNLKMLMHHAP